MAILNMKKAKRFFTDSVWKEAENLVQSGFVERLSFVDKSETTTMIPGVVRDTDSRPFKVTLRIEASLLRGNIESICSCSLGGNCAHAAALFLASTAYSRYGEKPQRAPAIREYLEKLESQISEENPLYPSTQKERLLFVLKPESLMLSPDDEDEDEEESSLVRNYLTISLFVGKVGAGEKFTSFRPYNIESFLNGSPANFLHLKDLAILRRLWTGNYSAEGTSLCLSPTEDSEILKVLLKTGRLFWKTAQHTSPLKEGKVLQGSLFWEQDGGGIQHLVYAKDKHEKESPLPVLPLFPGYVLEEKKNLLHSIQTDLEEETFSFLAQASPLFPENTSATLRFLSEEVFQENAPFPKESEAPKVLSFPPQPYLSLFTAKVSRHDEGRQGQEMKEELNLVQLDFLYHDQKASFGSHDDILRAIQDGKPVLVQRDLEEESLYAERLKNFGLTQLSKSESFKNSPYPTAFYFKGDLNKRQMASFIENFKTLEQDGWAIKAANDFPRVVLPVDIDWYGEVSEDKEDPTQDRGDWFFFEMGFVVNETKFNVLPALFDFVERNAIISQHKRFSFLEDDKLIYLVVNKSLLLPVTGKRIKKILTLFSEILSKHAFTDGKRKLRLNQMSARNVVEFEESLGGRKFNWNGHEILQSIGENLKEFKGLEVVQPPAALNATLRNYQQEGLSWLSFLGQYGFGGILADDMGLGKTLQTLSYLQYRKERNLSKAATLVIAPTSLISNWQNEAQKFTPDLKVLLLHGKNRHGLFDQVQDHDLVITTYPLLQRDTEFHLSQQYALLILDEAQLIKNPRAKISKISKQLHAEQRICLSGTPLENHLGELWSLFDFVAPGLLGTKEAFKKIYQDPIEQSGENEHLSSMMRRIGPFILRRTKEAVAPELPKKTEMVRRLDLSDVQRQLYESVRISMHEQIKTMMDEKGLQQSQLTILDALLKLRQICCDPRLLLKSGFLSQDQVKLLAQDQENVEGLQFGHSAKLNLLVTMLSELIQEGRKVLVFSQFTSMLALIEEALNKVNIDYVTLTGQTKNRDVPINQFQNGEAPVFLISLKAGGTGLNLTTADTVIHYDPWWNPAVEDQATDRAHRIGQDKPVFVYKMVSNSTVEERILKMQTRKKALAEGTYAQTGSRPMSLTAEDLESLFSPLE